MAELPAINATKPRMEELVSELTESDIVIWVLKADQPARALDAGLYSQFEEYYRQKESMQNKRPILIGVLSHVDVLDPSTQWNPPYDFEDVSVEKVRTINQALQYNQQLLPFEARYRTMHNDIVMASSGISKVEAARAGSYNKFCGIKTTDCGHRRRTHVQ